jgi:hypothetical protein
MKVRSMAIAAGICVTVGLSNAVAQRKIGTPITVRPAMLADAIQQLAGYDVTVSNARVVGVFNPRVFVVDTETRLNSVNFRDRIVVFIDPGALRVSSTSLVGSTVVVSGVARTLLGMQVAREVPWPSELEPDVVKRLEIRAAVLATSVRTAEGIELTSTKAAP